MSDDNQDAETAGNIIFMAHLSEIKLEENLKHEINLKYARKSNRSFNELFYIRNIQVLLRNYIYIFTVMKKKFSLW